jgi:hypothetical protein
LLTKINGKNKKFKSKEDTQKFLHLLFNDISQIKEIKNKS